MSSRSLKCHIHPYQLGKGTFLQSKTDMRLFLWDPWLHEALPSRLSAMTEEVIRGRLGEKKRANMAERRRKELHWNGSCSSPFCRFLSVQKHSYYIRFNNWVTFGKCMTQIHGQLFNIGIIVLVPFIIKSLKREGHNMLHRATKNINTAGNCSELQHHKYKDMRPRSFWMFQIVTDLPWSILSSCEIQAVRNQSMETFMQALWINERTQQTPTWVRFKDNKVRLKPPEVR